jgi:DNA-binding GntR family transcriptional regulator
MEPEPAAAVTLPEVRVVPASSLRSQVEQAISAAIISGEIPPGAVISVPTLAAQFSVSATPVREAMLDLEKRGFVEALRNKGFRVTDVDQEALRQIVGVRRLLEPQAFHQLALNFTAEHAVQARPLADRIVAGARDHDLNAYLAADHDFHLGLLRLLGNPLLVSIVSDLRERTRLVGLRTLLNTDELSISVKEHYDILSLLEAHDAEGVSALVHHHLGHVAGWWSGQPEDAGH